MRHRSLLLLLLLSLPAGASAQIPHSEHPLINTVDIRDFLSTAHFSRVVTVDAGGRGNYSKLSKALAYVATQTRSESQQWTVIVYGGGSLLGSGSTMNYVETRLVVPSYTTVRGFPGVAPSGILINSTANPTVELTGTSGDLISLDAGSVVSGINFFAFQTLTADTVMAHATGGEIVILENVQLWFNVATGSFAGDIFVCEALRCVLYTTHTIRGQFGSSATVRNVVAKSSLAIYGGRHQPGQGTGQAKLMESAAGGTIFLFWTRLIPGATVDLTATAGTAEIYFSQLSSYTGTVKGSTLFSHNGTANPSTCSPGQFFVNTTGGGEKVCACTVANIWKCANLS
jgi:hypothetical protein